MTTEPKKRELTQKVPPKNTLNDEKSMNTSSNFENINIDHQINMHQARVGASGLPPQPQHQTLLGNS